MEYQITFAGDSAVSIVLGNTISEHTNHLILAIQREIEQAHIAGITEVVPTYCSLMVHYLPEEIGWRKLCQHLRAICSRTDAAAINDAVIWDIPVLYGGQYGPDLSFVAEHNGLSESDVIRIHTGRDYLVYMLGFTPGFPYLGGMDDRIAAPRLDSPRVSIPAGSVGIAGSQTGIYPLASPGGWRLIGQTPVKLYAPDREQPILLHAGDYIRFVSIDRSEFDRIAAMEEKGIYRCACRSRMEEKL